MTFGNEKIANSKIRLSDIFRWTEDEEMKSFRDSLQHLKGLKPEEIRKNLFAFVEKEEFRVNQIIEILRAKVRRIKNEERKEILKHVFRKEMRKIKILKKIEREL